VAGANANFEGFCWLYATDPALGQDASVERRRQTHRRVRREQHRKAKTVVLVAPTQAYVNVMLEAGAELRSMAFRKNAVAPFPPKPSSRQNGGFT
jgi:hypothetical protein